MFRHPKYYKELRKRNKLDQAISDEASTEATSVRPGPGRKLQALKLQATSRKPQATSVKLQAASDKLPNSRALIKSQATSIRGLDADESIDRMFHVKCNLVW